MQASPVRCSRFAFENRCLHARLRLQRWRSPVWQLRLPCSRCERALRADAAERRRAHARGRESRRAGLPDRSRLGRRAHRRHRRAETRRARLRRRSESHAHRRSERETPRQSRRTTRSQFYQRDLFETDLIAGDRDHDVPAAAREPRPAAEAPGAEARHAHRLARFLDGRLEARASRELDAKDKYGGAGGRSDIYLWIIPAKVGGNWQSRSRSAASRSITRSRSSRNFR